MSNPRKTALVVEDDPEIRTLLSVYLQKLGFQVSLAGNGRLAMSKLDEERPSILCVDQMLPESSGYDVCEHVLRSPGLKGLPILMISARGMPGDRAWAEELGVRRYLVKPFTQAQFIEHIEATLREESPE